MANVMALISFWHVLGDNESALMSRFYRRLLLVTLRRGRGMLSLDHWIRRHCFPAAR
jgi:hypothetical protein